jgi:hypothetical protein
MPGKRVRFDDATWEAILAVSRSKDLTFEELADEAFADLLKKHKQPVGLKAARRAARSAHKNGEALASAGALYGCARFCFAKPRSLRVAINRDCRPPSLSEL